MSSSPAIGARIDPAAVYGAPQASIVSLLKSIANAGAPYQGATPLTAGTPGISGRALMIVCTTAGNIVVTYVDGSTLTIPVAVGASYVPGAITKVAFPGTNAAVATFANMK